MFQLDIGSRVQVPPVFPRGRTRGLCLWMPSEVLGLWGLEKDSGESSGLKEVGVGVPQRCLSD